MKAATALMLLCLPAIIKSFSLKICRPTERLFKPFHSSISKYSAVKTGSSVQMNNVLNSEIVLTAEEDELFATLRTVVSDGSLGTTVRVAGGWVRDKLLGVSGKEDIDIALDNMAGNDFAIALNTWHISKGTGISCFMTLFQIAFISVDGWILSGLKSGYVLHEPSLSSLSLIFLQSFSLFRFQIFPYRRDTEQP